MILLFLLLSTVQAADLNCDGVALADSPSVDLYDPACAEHFDLHGGHADLTDAYFAYERFGCRYPVWPSLDSDDDGYGSGLLTLGGDDGSTLDLAVTLSCDCCANDFNPEQIDSDGDGKGDLCDECPDDPAGDEDCLSEVETFDLHGGQPRDCACDGGIPVTAVLPFAMFLGWRRQIQPRRA